MESNGDSCYATITGISSNGAQAASNGVTRNCIGLLQENGGKDLNGISSYGTELLTVSNGKAIHTGISSNGKGKTGGPSPPKWNSRVYAEARPGYPDSLFKLLVQLTPRHDVAWDVGTGNGQAAVSLAQHYHKVIATDISQEQLSCAFTRPNVTYAKMNADADVEEVERIIGAEGSVDLVTVAAALHWFNLDSFFPRVHHVLRKPGGVFATWSYLVPTVSPEVDAAREKLIALSRTHGFSTEPRFDIVRNKSANTPFPFEPVLPNGAGTGPVRVEDVVKYWNLKEYLLYVESMAVVKKSLENGVQLLSPENVKTFEEAWGSPHLVRPVTFPTWLRVGRVPPPPA